MDSIIIDDGTGNSLNQSNFLLKPERENDSLAKGSDHIQVMRSRYLE